jgi:high affinity sulfate transporter 1
LTFSANKANKFSKWMPGLEAARTYQRQWLAKDIVAGLVLSTLLVPQGMAYAELAGLPAITGLYTTVMCLLAYAVFGPSPYLVLGPDSSLGPMIAAAMLPLLVTDDPAEAIALAGMLALFVGLISAGAGITKLGFVADLISKPVRIGYLAGLSITIFIGQLPKLLGISVDGDNIFDEVIGIFASFGQINWWAFSVGALALLIVIVLKRSKPNVPGILIAVVVAILISMAFSLSTKGVAVVGVLPQGFPIPSFPQVPLSSLPLLAAAALGMALVTIGDTISTSAGFAARRGDEVDSNQELIGIGSANLLAGFFQGFPVSTSSSRTAVAEQSGAKTQLTGLVAAALVISMLLFVPGLVQAMPQSVLAAVVIIASIGLFDIAELRRLWVMRKSEFLLAVVAILGVALVGVLEGIVIAIGLSILQFFERSWRPHSAVLGKNGKDGYQDIDTHAEAKQLDGLLIIRWDAPLFFANANIFRDLVRRLITTTEPTPHWVLITAEPMTGVDSTAADMLVDLDLELNASGRHLIFAELSPPVKARIVAYGLLDTIDHQHFYPTIKRAVKAFRKDKKMREAENQEQGIPAERIPANQPPSATNSEPVL